MRKLSAKRTNTPTRLPLFRPNQYGKESRVFISPDEIHDDDIMDMDANGNCFYEEDDSIQFSCLDKGCGRIDLGAYGPFLKGGKDLNTLKLFIHSLALTFL